MECVVCGASGDKVFLIDVISDEGISKICKKCQQEESLPLVKKSVYSEDTGDYGERKQSVYERLSRISGVDMNKNDVSKVNEDLQKQESNLKDIVKKNFEVKIKESPRDTQGGHKNLQAGDSGEPKPVVRNDLIDNFHWIIMRARRSKKLTQAQLGERIEELEVAIHMAEKGVLPEGYVLARKLENFLSIRIVKQQVEVLRKLPEKIETFDDNTTKSLTISDLKEMRKKKEMELFKPEKWSEEKIGDESSKDNSGEPEVLMEEVEEKIFINPELEEIEMEGIESEGKPEFVESQRDNPKGPKSVRDKKSFVDKKDLSEDEINDLIFGKSG